MFIVPTISIFHIYSFQIKAIIMDTALMGVLLLGLNNVKYESLKELFDNHKIKK